MSVDQYGRKIDERILMYTGSWFWPLDPRPEEVNIMDIAHHLSNQTRFTGAVREFYSVAQHSVLVSWLLRDDPALSLWGLLHDASEAYLSDIASPVKRGMKEYKAIEKRIMSAVSIHFNLSWPEPPEVKEADVILRQTEARDLMPPNFVNHEADGGTKPTLKEEIMPWPPKRAKAEFLSRYRELTSPPRFRACGLGDGCCGVEQEIETLSTIRLAEQLANQETI